MKSGKSPGTCGLTSEWYKFFWMDIKDILVTSINYNLRNGIHSDLCQEFFTTYKLETIKGKEKLAADLKRLGCE